MRAIALAFSTSLLLMTTAAGQSSSDGRQAVSQVVAACAIGPTNSFKDLLISKLEYFLQRAMETKSAKSADLMAIFAQMPTDTDEALRQLPAERARQTFFAIYFNCIRDQMRLKLRSLGIDLEEPRSPALPGLIR